MSKMINLQGQKFGRLTVIEPASRPKTTKSSSQHWRCRCDCQKEVVVDGVNLRSGNTTSCGCARKGRARKGRVHKHGMVGTRLYVIHHDMKQRCYNSNNKYYSIYGGRGIRVSDEWLGENGFINFSKWAMTHGYSDNLTIDRIEVNGNYEPNNCRWADYFTQAKNRRPRSNKMGHTGIYKKQNGKYESRITANKKLIHLGTFETFEEAVEARERAERELYPENKN